jgi:putative transposase
LLRANLFALYVAPNVQRKQVCAQQPAQTSLRATASANKFARNVQRKQVCAQQPAQTSLRATANANKFAYKSQRKQVCAQHTPMSNQRDFYRRSLPHFQPIGGVFFVTFRLNGTIPSIVAAKLKEEFRIQKKLITNSDIKDNAFFQSLDDLKRKHFLSFENWLEKAENNSITWLDQQENAEAVKKQLHRHDGNYYDLIAYTIMPNHVHILINTSVQLHEEYWLDDEFHFVQLERIMKNIKGPCAIDINRNLHRTGKVWQRESFDHLVRNEISFDRIVRYILNNPVKSHFVDQWQHWPHTFLTEGYI